MRDPGLNTWTFYEPDADGGEIAPPIPGDALSNPAVEDLLPAGLACWPRGPAWGTPDGVAASADSTLARFAAGVALPDLPAECRERMGRVVPKEGEKWRWVQKRWEMVAEAADQRAARCAAFYDDTKAGFEAGSGDARADR